MRVGQQGKRIDGKEENLRYTSAETLLEVKWVAWGMVRDITDIYWGGKRGSGAESNSRTPVCPWGRLNPGLVCRGGLVRRIQHALPLIEALLRARLPIDGRLATRDSADHKRRSVPSIGFKLYARPSIS